MLKRKKVLNPQIGLEFLCYAAFAVLVLYLISSGKYQNYVAPKMVPYLYFSAVVMTIWAFSGLFRLFRPQYKTHSAHCLVLAIPILLLLLPHAPVSASDLSSGYLSGNAIAGLSGQNAAGFSNPKGSVNNPDPDIPSKTEDPGAVSTDGAANDTDDLLSGDILPSADKQAGAQSDSQASGQDVVPKDIYGNDLVGLDVKNKKITVEDDYFYPWIAEIYTNLDQYEGYQIAVTGFVFKDPGTMKSNEFSPARLMMSCCVADLMPVGFVCRYDNASGLEADSWVTVEGTIFKGEYMGEAEPQISVKKVSPAEEVEGYVYP